MTSNYYAPLIVDTGMHPSDLSEISTFNGPILVLSVDQTNRGVKRDIQLVQVIQEINKEIKSLQLEYIASV